jgi:hypothetical protein
MKKPKIAIIVLFAFGILALIYFIGYRIGKRVDDRQHLVLSLDKDVYLYHIAQRGDLPAVKSSLGFFICGQFKTYEQRFGEEHFLHFDDARQIATIAATNGDVVWFTNLVNVLTNRMPPNQSLEPTPTAVTPAASHPSRQP